MWNGGVEKCDEAGVCAGVCACVCREAVRSIVCVTMLLQTVVRWKQKNSQLFRTVTTTVYLHSILRYKLILMSN